jgi:hypothetical protein
MRSALQATEEALNARVEGELGALKEDFNHKFALHAAELRRLQSVVSKVSDDVAKVVRLLETINARLKTVEFEVAA